MFFFKDFKSAQDSTFGFADSTLSIMLKFSSSSLDFHYFRLICNWLVLIIFVSLQHLTLCEAYSTLSIIFIFYSNILNLLFYRSASLGDVGILYLFQFYIFGFALIIFETNYLFFSRKRFSFDPLGLLNSWRRFHVSTFGALFSILSII